MESKAFKDIGAAVEACFLAGVGGCVDAVGVLSLGGLFVSHMSGNTAALGAAFGQGHWLEGLPHLFAVPVFVAGLFCGYVWIVGKPTFRRCALLLVSEAVLLALFVGVRAVYGDSGTNTAAYYAAAALPLFAMGIQNATLRQVGRSVFPTTYITGVLDTLSRAAAQALLQRHSPVAWEKMALARHAAVVWICYVCGALVGSAGLLLLDVWILSLPVAILLVLAWRFSGMAGGFTDLQPSGPVE